MSPPAASLRLAASFLIASASVCSGAPVSFSRDIAPVLVEQCLECHREGKSKGAYRLDDFALLQKPGDSESPPVTPGNPEASELLRLVATADEDERMPRKGDPLPPEKIELIARWIKEGARYDGGDPRAKLARLVPEKPFPKPPAAYPHPHPVAALAASPDGARLAVSGYHEITLWDLATGALAARIQGLPERTHAIVWLDAKTIITAGGKPLQSGEAWLVDAGQRRPLRRIHTTTDTILAAAITRDGTKLALAGADNRVSLLAMPEAKLLWTVEPHADWVTALSFSGDGSRLATASRDRSARFLFPASGEIECTFSGHDVPVLSVAILPNNKEALSGDATGSVRHWDREGVAKKDTTIRPARSEVLQIAFLDEAPVVAMGNGLVATLNEKERKVRDQIARHADRVNAMQVIATAAGKRLITGSHDGEVRVWDMTSKKELLRFIASPGSPKLPVP